MCRTILLSLSAVFLATSALTSQGKDMPPADVARFSLPRDRVTLLTKPHQPVRTLAWMSPALNMSEAWSLEAAVSPPDTFVDGGQSLAMNMDGVPWVVWYRKIKWSADPTLTYWSRWEGDHWRAPALVDSTYGGMVFKPRIGFDRDNVAWVVWNQDEGSEIWFTRGHDGLWDKAEAVHAPDPYDYYSPEIGCGGGETWLTWYGNDGHNEYDIFVTHWNGSGWDVPQNLTADLPGFHWFCDIAVDGGGIPHLIWGNSQTGELLYTFKRPAQAWQAFETINQGPVIPDGWPMSDIRMDSAGNVHVAWVGRIWEGATLGDADLYYSLRRNNLWSVPRQVNEPDDDWTYYPELAVQDSAHIWFTWGDEGGSWTEAASVHAAYFDGQSFSEETHLDTGSFWWNQGPRIQLDAKQEPWVMWGAIEGDFSESAILYSVHLDTPVPVLFSGLTGLSDGNRVRLNWWAGGSAFSRFDVERVQSGSFSTVGTLDPLHEGIYEWEESGLAAGRYTYRIVGTLRNGLRQYLGPIQVSVDNIPKRLLLATSGGVQGSLSARVGLPIAGMVTLFVYDIGGRLIHARPAEFMLEGWHDLRIDSLLKASGVYMLKASSGEQDAFAKLILVR